MSSFWIAALVVLASFVALQALFILGLLRRIAPVLERAEAALASAPVAGGLPPGTPAPPFELRSANGSKLTSSELAGRPYVLLFVRSGCAPCARLAEEIRTGRGPDLGVELVVVTNESDDGADFPQGPHIVNSRQVDGDVSRVFATTVTPHAFAIDSAQTVVASGFPNTLEQLRALARDAQKGGAE